MSAQPLPKIFTKFAKKSHIFIFLIAILIGILTRFIFLTSYIQFDGEQARSGFILMDMWQGKIPTLGAPSSVGSFGILPYYYYWTFLWTIFGNNPIWQAMSNTFPSFLLIILVFITIYKLLHANFVSLKQIWRDFQASTNSKLLIASFGSLFYSVFFTEIFYSQMEWNPNAGTFWLILLLLTLEKLWNLESDNPKKILQKLQTKSQIVWEENLKNKIKTTIKFAKITKILSQKSWNTNQILVKKIFSLSILVGILVNLLLSLHSSFLFTTPIFCLIFGYFWLFKKKDKLTLGLAFGSILFFSLPYWFGEFGRNFENINNLFRTLAESNSSQNMLQKFNRLLFSTLEIGKLAYFPDNNLFLFSHIFLTVLIILTILFYAQIKSVLLNLLIIFWLIFVFISSNFAGLLHIHYLVIIWAFPCFLSAILIHLFLNYRPNYRLNFKPIFDKSSINFIIIFMIFGIILSFGVNIFKVYTYAKAKFGQDRITNTQDMIAIMEILPRESPICLINLERKNSVDYLNQFVVFRAQKISICDQNSLKNLEKNGQNGQIRSNLQSQSSQAFEPAKIFVFWENYNSEMTLTTKPIWLQSWQARQKIGNIEILQKQ